MAQWAVAEESPLVISFIGIFFPVGVVHHSISSPHPLQAALFSNLYPAAFISFNVFGNAMLSSFRIQVSGGQMLTLILMVFAFCCFVLAAIGVPSSPRFNLVAAGLAFWSLSVLLAAHWR